MEKGKTLEDPEQGMVSIYPNIFLDDNFKEWRLRVFR